MGRRGVYRIGYDVVQPSTDPQPLTLRLLPYAPERDVYRLLQVDPTASAEEIVAACRRLSRAFHPDRNRSPRATEEMQVVNEVRRVMTDPRERAEYDFARLRWYSRLPEREPAAWQAGSTARPFPLLGPRTASPTRYARATLVGARAVMSALVPPRCPGCRMVVRDEDRFCGACGSRLVEIAASA